MALTAGLWIRCFTALIFLQLVTAEEPLQPSKKLSAKSFKYYGSHTRGFEICTGFGYDPQNYVKFEGNVPWDVAKEGCKEIHQNLSLLSIESKQKHEFVQCLLKSNEDTGKFWTSGRYDETKGAFVWDENGLTLPAFAPWSPGQPPKFPTKQLRVAIERTPFGKVTWQSLSTEDGLVSFLCQAENLLCSKVTDVLFLLESNIFETLPTFESQLAVVRRVVKALHEVDGSRTGVMIYFGDAETEIPIPLNTPLTGFEIEQSVANLTSKNGTNSWIRGIRDAVQHFKIHGRNGQRKNVVFFGSFWPDKEDVNERKNVINEAISAGIHFHPVLLVRTNELNFNFEPRDYLDLVQNDASRLLRVKASIPEIFDLFGPLVDSICKK